MAQSSTDHRSLSWGIDLLFTLRFQISQGQQEMKNKCCDVKESHERNIVDPLNQWGPVTYICVGKPTINGSDNGLSPGRCQAIIWTSDGILLIGNLEINFREILISIHIFLFYKMHLKMSSAKWRQFCVKVCTPICRVWFLCVFITVLIVPMWCIPHLSTVAYAKISYSCPANMLISGAHFTYMVWRNLEHGQVFTPIVV